MVHTYKYIVKHIVLGLTVLLSTLPLTFSNAAPQAVFSGNQNQSSYVHWTLERMPAEGFRSIRQLVNVQESDASQFYATRFQIKSDPAWGLGGYIGLQTNVELGGRRGKAAIFSLWGATKTLYLGGSRAHRCRAFDAVNGDAGAIAEGGFGRSCLIALNWADGQNVDVWVRYTGDGTGPEAPLSRVQFAPNRTIKSSVPGRWYTGSVRINGTYYDIAKYFIPKVYPRWIRDNEPDPANRLIRDSTTEYINYVENFLEDFSGSPRECQSVNHRNWVRWSAPRPLGGRARFDRNRVDAADRNCFRIQQHPYGSRRVTLRSDPLGSYVKTATRRLHDSRFSGGELVGNIPRTVSVRQCGWSRARTAAVVLTVKAVNPRSSGFLAAYAPSMYRTTASTLNYRAAENASAQVTMLPDKDGNVSFRSSGPAHLVVDCVGRYDIGRTTGKTTLLNSHTRLVDTRDAGNRPIRAREERAFRVGGGRIPAGASAAILNITTLGAQNAGFLTAFQWGDARDPSISSLNYPSQKPRASQVVVPMSPGGWIGLFSNQQTDVIIDAVGWIGSSSNPGLYRRGALHAYRTFDSRYDSNGRFNPAAGKFIGRKTIDLGNLPLRRKGVEVSIAVTDATGGGFVSVSRRGQAAPFASTLNFVAGQATANTTMIPLPISNDNKFDVHVVGASANVIVDVTGFIE